MEFITAAFSSRAVASPSATPKQPALPILPLTSIDTLTRWNDAPIHDYDAIDSVASIITAASESIPPAQSTTANPTGAASLSDASAAASSASSLASSAASGGSIQFSVNPSLNRKLILCQTDLLGLKVDAIVNSTNERISDLHQTTLSHRLASYCGQSFVEECMSLVRSEGGVATGDAAIVSSHSLGRLHGASKWIIHAVSPKYAEKYQTAAENALHGCVRRSLEVLLDQGLHSVAFPLIATARKSYPQEEAAHITLRTLRMFMNRYGEKTLETVVLCFQEPPALSGITTPSSSSTAVIEPPLDETSFFHLYSRLLPLYFPRSSTEAALQLTLLPRSAQDGVNELGERVVEERRIRIGDFIAAGPRPFTEEERDRAGSAASTMVDASSSSAIASPATAARSRSSSSSILSGGASSSLLPSKTEYVSPADMPPQDSGSSNSSSGSGVARVHDVVAHDEINASLAAHVANPDDARWKAAISSSAHERQMEQSENITYYQRLKQAEICQHSDMAVLDAANYLFDVGRKDVLGRTVIQAVGSRVPLYLQDGTPHVSIHHLTDHVIRTLDRLTLHPFIAIYWHAGVDHTNRPDISWFRETYQLFTRAQKTNMKKLIVVHPTFYLRSAMYFLASFVSKDFWNKLVYVHKLSELSDHIDARSLQIPSHVLYYDRRHYGVTSLTANLHQQNADDVGL